MEVETELENDGQGHSYNDIGAITGWSYTKVNRCLAEGRRSFLERYAGIESGDECARWMPVLSAIVDGEATQAQIDELRPHLRNCPGCRGRLKALRDSSEPLAALFPVPLAIAAAAPTEHVSNLILRAYEAVAGGLHERAVYGATKAQAAIEAASAGKVAAVAASAAAVAGGGYASVETSPRGSAPLKVSPQPHKVVRRDASRVDRVVLKAPSQPQRPTDRPNSTEFGQEPSTRRAAAAPEFPSGSSTDIKYSREASTNSAQSRQQPRPSDSAAPEFATSAATSKGGEFGP